MTYLYLYEGADGRIYIGIGNEMTRPWQAHNEDAQALLADLTNPITRCWDQPHRRYAGTDDGLGAGRKLDTKQLTLIVRVPEPRLVVWSHLSDLQDRRWAAWGYPSVSGADGEHVDGGLADG